MGTGLRAEGSAGRPGRFRSLSAVLARVFSWIVPLLRQPLAQIGLGAAVLLAPIFYNGWPFLFTDTGTYFQSGYRALYGLVGRREGASLLSDTYLAARSPYYGAPITLLDRAATVWSVVALQAVAAAFALWLLAKAIDLRRQAWSYAILIVGLTCASALPLFVGFVMPDLFAGLALAYGAILITYPERLTKRETIWAWIALVASLAFHATHFMVALAIIPPAIAGAWRFDRERAARALQLGGSALAATAALVILFLIVNALSPTPQRAPPFLTARVLADGPGRTWLRRACSEDPNAYVLCRFKNLKLDQGDPILWSWDKKIGVFTASDLPTRIKLIEEQPRFVLDTVQHEPFAQLYASLRNAALQFIAIGLDSGFRIDGKYWLTYPPDFYLRQVVERINACPHGAKKCVTRLPLDAMTTAHIVFVVLGGLYLALAALLRLGPTWRVSNGDRTDWTLFWLAAGFILAGLVVNAVACGVISGPFPRYQARVAWLVPALAMLAEVRFPLIAKAIPGRRADPG
jgi:hypothetical protein